MTIVSRFKGEHKTGEHDGTNKPESGSRMETVIEDKIYCTVFATTGSVTLTLIYCYLNIHSIHLAITGYDKTKTLLLILIKMFTSENKSSVQYFHVKQAVEV